MKKIIIALVVSLSLVSLPAHAWVKHLIGAAVGGAVAGAVAGSIMKPSQPTATSGTVPETITYVMPTRYVRCEYKGGNCFKSGDYTDDERMRAKIWYNADNPGRFGLSLEQYIAVITTKKLPVKSMTLMTGTTTMIIEY